MTIFIQFQCHTKSPFKQQFEYEPSLCGRSSTRAGEDGEQQTRKEPQTPPLQWAWLGTRGTAIWSNIQAKTGHSLEAFLTSAPAAIPLAQSSLPQLYT